MHAPREVLLVDAGGDSMEVLSARLRRLGCRAVWTKTTQAARDALLDSRHAFGAAVVPPDLPTANLRAALQVLRAPTPESRLQLLVAGARPGIEGRRLLRAAGVDLALWNPIDQHTLQFQINRALARAAEASVERGALRAPADWPVRVRARDRIKPARVYSLSASGAYLATPRPSLRKVLLHVELPLPSGCADLEARVVMTNVPGNLMRRNLPIGMGVRFEGATVEAEAALLLYVEGRRRALAV